MLKDEKQEEKMTKVLFRTLLACKNEEDVKALLEDLCTYTEVISATNISSATLSRVSRCVRYGSGGYEKFVPARTAEEIASEEDGQSGKEKK